MNKEVRSNLLMLLAAIIWGVAFIAQKQGGLYIGSFTFNGIRFGLGCLSLLPLLFYIQKNKNHHKDGSDCNSLKTNQAIPEYSTESEKLPDKNQKYCVLKAGLILGIVLFIGITLQQIGLIYTTAGKAAFITGFYIVLVPLFGIFLKQKISGEAWMAAALSILGLYLISITDGFRIIKGDLLELAGSFFWAAHIILTHRYTQKFDALELSFIQFAICSILSICFAVVLEDISVSGIIQALIPLLYGGVASVGVAYTLQAVGQKYAKPSHAAIILSLESVIAVIAGIILLGESMSAKGYVGCILMFAGVLISQLAGTKKAVELSSQAFHK